MKYSLILIIFLLLNLAYSVEVRRGNETYIQSNTETFCNVGDSKVTFTRELKEYTVNEIVNGGLESKTYSLVEIKLKSKSFLKNIKLLEIIPKSLLNAKIIFDTNFDYKTNSEEGLTAVWGISELNPGEEKIIKYSIDRKLTPSEINSYLEPKISAQQIKKISSNYIPLILIVSCLVLFEIFVILKMRKRK